MLQFQHIEYLLALAVVPLLMALYFFVIKWKKDTAAKIGDPMLVKQLVEDYSPFKFSMKFFMFLTAFAIAVIAWANPRLPQGSTKVNRSGIDVMIALDVSRSMLAQDIKPDRLQRAKQVLAKLIDRLDDDRIGIVVFAGRAYLQMPLTTDHAAAKMYLSSVSPEAVPTQGTVISDALKMSFSAFSSKEKKYKSIVLISDGEDHDEGAVTYAKSLADEGVMINTIGIGSPDGATIMDPETNEIKKDEAGNPVISKLNETELKNIAENGNGIYQYFTNSDEVVRNIEAQLKTMGQRPITESSLINYRNLFPWFLGLALLLLILEFFISELKPLNRKPSPVKTTNPNPFVLAFLIVLVPAGLLAQKGNKEVKKGNEAYKNSRYEIAIENYKKAISKNAENLPAQYNLGNALYKNTRIEDALAAYDVAIQQSKLPLEKSGAFYNKGVVLQNNKKLPECIEAYKDALRLNPADEDARLNLQKALLQQKQQQQQQKDNKDNKEKKKPKEEQKKDKQKQQEEKDKDELPKPQPSKMTKREAEEKLKALLQQEKKLQDKLRRVNAASPSKPGKDW